MSEGGDKKQSGENRRPGKPGDRGGRDGKAPRRDGGRGPPRGNRDRSSPPSRNRRGPEGSSRPPPRNRSGDRDYRREGQRGDGRGRMDGRDGRDRQSRDFRGPDIRGKVYFVYVGMPDKFFDDIIRERYVLPAIELLSSEQIDKVVYMARGMAINTAVRAALLLEEIMGVMKKEIKIDSSPAPERGLNPKRGAETEKRGDEKEKRRVPRLISEIEIALTRF